MGFFKKIFNPNLEPEGQAPEVTDEQQLPVEQTDAPDAADVTVEVITADEAPVEVTPPEVAEAAPAEAAPAAGGGDPLLGDHVQAAHATLIDWIIAALAPLRGGLADDDVHDMVIHVAEARIRLLMGEAFVGKLRLALDNNLLSPVAAGEISVTGELSTAAAADAINAGDGRLQLVLVSRRRTGGQVDILATGRALITAVEGTGSLEQECYELDASTKTLFHIGRGRVARQGGNIRVNDIVINERETDPRLMEMNRQVSSAHADILCRRGAFYLKAMPGGCRPEGGAVTRVFHGETGRELRDTFTLEPLHDGDLIALGGAMLLRFQVMS
ncbi:MAG: hypothetical protein IKW85_05035 [Muribaculaceae bacterium]|nr:hypothetical protein [Muribaculaceae bacterium]